MRESLNWFAPAPAERLALLRQMVGLFCAIYLLIRFGYLWSFGDLPAGQFAPIGVLSWLDSPLAPALYRVFLIATVALSVPFTLGLAHRWLAPVFAVLLWVVLTYSNSWGTILHTDNLLLLHVTVLALSAAADRDGRGPQYGWPIKLMCTLCVAAYFIAGVAKIKNSGWAFVEGENLRNYVALANVRKIELGSQHSPLGVLFLEHARAFQVMATVSLALELGAPLALLHRKLGQLWAACMWGFHLGVLALMAIGFFYPLTFIAFLSFFRIERSRIPRLRLR